MFRIRITPAPARLAIDPRILFAILTAEALALFAMRLAGTLQFDNFAFFDPGANLTVQYLIRQGYRPTIDFGYPYGLLPVWLGRIWFRIFGLTPIACAGAIPLIDILLIWGFVRLATKLKINLAGVLIILLTVALTIPSSFENFTHRIEPALLLHALADQAGGNRRRALALAAACLFVKPSMAYFLGLVLILFIVVDCWLGDRPRLMREFMKNIYPAAGVVIAVAAILAASFGPTAVVRSMIPTQGLAIYRAEGYGFFNSGGRLFLAPRGVPWSYYFENVAGPWIVYTIVLVAAALIVARDAVAGGGAAWRSDPAPEMIVTCALLHLSFIFFFFGNQFTWFYYYYILVIGLAATARLGIRWELLVGCLAFAVPFTTAHKRIAESLAFVRYETSMNARRAGSGMAATPALPDETGFTYKVWFTTSPSPETADLWAAPDERAEWAKVLAMVEGHHAALLEIYGCGDLLFPEFSPPVTVYLVPGGVTAGDISRKLAQLQASSMIVMPRRHSQLLDDIPEIGDLMRRDFVPAFQGASFIVYARRQG